jgi:hypothetical protein
MLVATLISVPTKARCVHRDYGDWCCCCSLCVVQHPAADAVSITQDASSGDAELPAALMMLTCCSWLTTEEEALQIVKCNYRSMSAAADEQQDPRAVSSAAQRAVIGCAAAKIRERRQMPAVCARCRCSLVHLTATRSWLVAGRQVPLG